MDEHEWNYSTDPYALLEAIPQPSTRKLRLFCAAACHHAEVAPDFLAQVEPILEVVERYADGSASASELDAVHDQAGDIYARGEDAPNFSLADAVLESTMVVLYTDRVIEALYETRRRPPQPHEPPQSITAAELMRTEIPRIDPELQDEVPWLASLLREVFRNPFYPVVFDPSWRTEAVVGLARGMYEGRDFGPMSVLADALEDAGCASADVLAHCRGPGPHVRGCWVVDLVLGKA